MSSREAGRRAKGVNQKDGDNIDWNQSDPIGSTGIITRIRSRLVKQLCLPMYNNYVLIRIQNIPTVRYMFSVCHRKKLINVVLSVDFTLFDELLV